ncbi:MAG: DUF6273 domain-containing protein [Acutalibacteraceae bacterium]|nr:DUF6273 domain-containing protein [Acutalibacteraceae bacterium]
MNIFKKIASAVLVFSLMLSVTACSAKKDDEPASDTPIFTANTGIESETTPVSSKYKAGDLVHFGEYPSILVPESVQTELNKLSLEWKNYDYYSGDGTVGSMAKNNYMKYADVTYKGHKYRAVQITEYRPESTYKKTVTGASTNGKKPQQAVNSFELNKTYWFMYQPLVWRVLDPAKGLIICENIIDAQPYSNTVYQNGEEYYSDPAFTKLAYDYENSSVRQWLSNDANGFYNIAFNESEKKLIKEVEIKNRGEYNFGYDSYQAPPTKEKVYLLSSSESEKEEYNLDAEAYSTFYAWIQGAEIEYNYATDVAGQCTWITRTPARLSMFVCEGGVNASNKYVYTSACGIRPAVQLSNLNNLEPGKDIMKEAMEK